MKKYLKDSNEERDRLIYDHKKASKPIVIEEPLDYYFIRRIAALLVRPLLNTKVSPNQITIASIMIGIFAGVFLIYPATSYPALAGFTIFLSLVLDCVDGQLARSRGGGTRIGRILDGYADYVYTFMYYLASMIISMRLITEPTDFVILLWTAGAGASNVVHAALYDYFKNIYVTYTDQEYKEKADTVEEIIEEKRRAQKNRKFFDIFLYNIYITYLKFQKKLSSAKEEITEEKKVYDKDKADIYKKYHTKVIRLWSYIGNSTHLFILVIGSFIMPFDTFGYLYSYIFISIFTNLYMILIFMYQIRATKKTKQLFKRLDR